MSCLASAPMPRMAKGSDPDPDEPGLPEPAPLHVADRGVGMAEARVEVRGQGGMANALGIELARARRRVRLMAAALRQDLGCVRLMPPALGQDLGCEVIALAHGAERAVPLGLEGSQRGIALSRERREAGGLHGGRMVSQR